MKNLLLALAIICVLCLVCIYAFIPAKITFSKVVIIKAKINIADRFLLDESKWAKWFPDYSTDSSTPTDKKTFRYKDYFYAIEKRMLNVAQISISNHHISLKSLLTTISVNQDSLAIEWKSDMPATSNPIRRISNYIQARRLQNSMVDILKTLQTFLKENDRIYGMHFHTVISKDSTLIATQSVFKHYPSTQDIYNLIKNLKNYIISRGANENNFPMLNVRKVDDTTFETMVAIPVNKYLKDSGSIFHRRFVPWKVLTAEVRGGDYTVNEALDQMVIYRNDNQIQAMAIPFASLVTDRSKQPDTLQWVTRIYTPVP